MLKTNRIWVIVSSLIILLPVLIGLVLWDEIPDVIASHWGPDGAIDGYSGKAAGLFVPAAVLLAGHILCIAVTRADVKNKGQNAKVMRMVLWLCPLLSVFIYATIYGSIFGAENIIYYILPVVFGAMFIVIGNYLPKIKPNRTIGIRLPWTFASEENWNRTHRFGGRLWVVGGAMMLLTALLPKAALIPAAAALIVAISLAPMIYSFVLYKKQFRAGRAEKPSMRAAKLSGILALLILAAVIVLMFTGDIDIILGDNSFKIEADYYNDLTVDYAAIESVEFRDKCEAGVRTNGFGSARLAMGGFNNAEFGSYTRYTYNGCEACVVLKAQEKTLVINAKDASATRALYEALMEKLPGDDGQSANTGAH